MTSADADDDADPENDDYFDDDDDVDADDYYYHVDDTNDDFNYIDNAENDDEDYVDDAITIIPPTPMPNPITTPKRQRKQSNFYLRQPPHPLEVVQ